MPETEEEQTTPDQLTTPETPTRQTDHLNTPNDHMETETSAAARHDPQTQTNETANRPKDEDKHKNMIAEVMSLVDRGADSRAARALASELRARWFNTRLSQQT